MSDNQLKGIFWRGDFDDYYLGHQFSEIFKDRIYKPYLEHLKDPVVIDLGANIGLFTLYASKYAKQVYSIEPSLEHFDLLRTMIRSNNLTNVTPIKSAIWIENKQMPFFHNKNKTMYSLHMAVNDGSSQEEMVDGMTFDRLFNEYKIEHVDLLKADIEGSEYELFASEGFKKIANKVDTIMGEAHVWANRNPNQLKDAFQNNGFDFKWLQHEAQIFVAINKNAQRRSII